MHKQMLKSTSGLDGKFLTMVCCQEMLVQQEEKDVSFNSKKRIRKNRKNMIPLKILSWGFLKL